MDDSEPAHSTDTATPSNRVAAEIMPSKVETGVLHTCAQWREAGFDEALVRRAAAAAIGTAIRDDGHDYELAVLLTSDAGARDLNLQWRGKDRPANVLSFSLGTEAGQCGQVRVLGDIVLAFETVAGEAQHLGLPLADHATHLVVHGVLHLLGYDHQSEVQAEIMENLERQVLAGLGLHDPYETAGELQDAGA